MSQDTSNCLYCNWCGCLIVDENKAVWWRDGFYCSTEHKNNAMPMSTPSTAKYAGGGQFLRRGADMRWQISRSIRIIEEEVVIHREQLIRWLLSVIKPEFHREIHMLDYPGLLRLADAVNSKIKDRHHIKPGDKHKKPAV